MLQILPDIPDSERKNRLAMHVLNVLREEEEASIYAAKLIDTPEDRLSIAALEYFKGNYREASEMYRNVSLHFGYGFNVTNKSIVIIKISYIVRN